jgi:hypothetical protein
LTAYDLAAFFYPSDEEIERVGVRGIYVSNYIEWDDRKHAEFVIDKLGFETAQERDRTFNLYAKLDDLHANGTHDYLKYLKYGYGRATDDGCTEIRRGRMTREQAIDLIMQYDHKRPRDLDVFLRAVNMTEGEFEAQINHLRDPSIWQRDGDGKWRIRDNIGKHRNDPGVEEARLPQRENARPFIRTEKFRSVKPQEDGAETDYVTL